METRVKELMQERGLRASDVAARVGQPVAVVSNELSRGLTSVPSVAKYARALRVPVWELLHRPVVSAMGKELAAWSEPSDDKGAATRIGAIMRERGLTQLQVAERMGAIRQNVNKWVTSTKLNLSTLQSFATALEIDAEHLYLLFVSQEEYDREMERRASLDPAMMAEVERMQRAEKAVNNYQLSENNGLRADVNEMGTEPDLFTQMEEAEQGQTAEDDRWKTLPDGCYAYGNVRIQLFHGRITISEKPKHH